MSSSSQNMGIFHDESSQDNIDADGDSNYSIDKSTYHLQSPPSSDDDSYSLDSFSIDTTPDFNIDDHSLSEIISCVNSLVGSWRRMQLMPIPVRAVSLKTSRDFSSEIHE